MIIQTISDFSEILTIARRHGAAQIKIGDIEVQFGLPASTPDEKPAAFTTTTDMPQDLNAEAWTTFSKI